MEVDRLVFTGGSDGSDLVRNGRELREVGMMKVYESSSLWYTHVH